MRPRHIASSNKTAGISLFRFARVCVIVIFALAALQLAFSASQTAGFLQQHQVRSRSKSNNNEVETGNDSDTTSVNMAEEDTRSTSKNKQLVTTQSTLLQLQPQLEMPLLTANVTDPWKVKLYTRLDNMRKKCGALCNINNLESFNKFVVTEGTGAMSVPFNDERPRTAVRLEAPVDCKKKKI